MYNVKNEIEFDLFWESILVGCFPYGGIYKIRSYLSIGWVWNHFGDNMRLTQLNENLMLGIESTKDIFIICYLF